MEITIIGIAGGSASGKTTVVRKLGERFGNQIQVLGHDNYYRSHDGMPFAQRAQLNYDHPDAFETEYMVRHIQELKAGHAIQHPTYDYTVHNRAKATVRMEPRPVIIVEGILVLEDARLRELMDLRIFVDTDAEERLAAVFCGIPRREAAAWSRCSISTAPLSSPCMRNLWSPAKNMRISLFPGAAIINRLLTFWSAI